MRVERDSDVVRSTRDESFGREKRLRSSREFQRVRRGGKRRQGRWLTLFYARREDASLPSRAGFSVSKRVGEATQRNKVKRRLREAVRRQLWNVTPGWDMIVMARPEAAHADYDTLVGAIADLLAQARLARPSDRA